MRRVTAPETPLLPRLGALDIELTERCDSDCIHCCINLPAGDAAARARELTTAQWKDVLDQAAALGCLQVRFTGGEPLLRPDFEELYLHARRLGMKVLLFTNARAFGAGKDAEGEPGGGARAGAREARGRGERLVELLARVPPIVPVEVTVYGMHKESYEAVTRAPGSYEQFRRGVDRLLAAGVPFIVKGVLLPPNKHERDEFEAWAATLPAMDGPPSYSLCLDLRNRRDDPEKNAQIAAMRLSPEECLAVLTRDEARYRREKAEFAASFMGPPGDQLFRCGVGQAVSIDAYGRAQPCMGLRAPEFTVDLFAADRPIAPGAAAKGAAGGTGPLAAALDRFAALRDVRATNADYLRRCARCFLHGLCEQCAAKSWSEHGTLDTPVEYHCAVAHTQARFVGWLSEREHSWEVAQWRRRIRDMRGATGLSRGAAARYGTVGEETP